MVLMKPLNLTAEPYAIHHLPVTQVHPSQRSTDLQNKAGRCHVMQNVCFNDFDGYCLYMYARKNTETCFSTGVQWHCSLHYNENGRYINIKHTSIFYRWSNIWTLKAGLLYLCCHI